MKPSTEKVLQFFKEHQCFPTKKEIMLSDVVFARAKKEALEYLHKVFISQDKENLIGNPNDDNEIIMSNPNVVQETMKSEGITEDERDMIVNEFLIRERILKGNHELDIQEIQNKVQEIMKEKEEADKEIVILNERMMKLIERVSEVDEKEEERMKLEEELTSIKKTLSTITMRHDVYRDMAKLAYKWTLQREKMDNRGVDYCFLNQAEHRNYMNQWRALDIEGTNESEAVVEKLKKKGVRSSICLRREGETKEEHIIRAKELSKRIKEEAKEKRKNGMFEVVLEIEEDDDWLLDTSKPL